MKPSAVLGGIGAVIGAVVVVLTHLYAHGTPDTLYEGSATQDGVGVTLSSGQPVYEHLWWPVLPMGIAIGLVLGVLAALALRRLGLSLARVPELS